MVWFQCESCGENLKKPKLVNHFRGCAARKLSCIDCGVVFDQQSVQAHTSCVSETEKYGPKDGSNGAAQKPKSSQAHKDGDVDLSIGLSSSFPWNCSLCNVNATSYETLESHAQGKKHRAKAKVAHAKLNSVPVVEAASNSHEDGSQPKASAETKGSEPVEDGKLLPTSEGKQGVEVGKLLPASKGKGGDLEKRKAGDKREKKSGEKRKKSNKGEKLLDTAAEKGIVSSEIGGGDKLEVENSTLSLAYGKPVKWRKLTTKVLKNLKAPEKGVKIKELFNEILPLVTSGADNFDKEAYKKQLAETLNASSKFEVRGDWVALATTS